MKSISDILIIGGGINGTGIAADAAGRGLSVTLCEKGDPGSGTSSCSTKLIHGGLRYLSQYAFRLVRKSLRESEILAKKAPHLITPMEFVLPHAPYLRPAWMIRAGLFLYDHLAKRHSIPHSGYLNLTQNERGTSLKEQFSKGFFYFDFFADDARLVIENIISASENQAEILTHTRFLSAERTDGIWIIKLRNEINGHEFVRHAKALVNAAGPWVRHVNQQIQGITTAFQVSLIRGTHIVIPKLYKGDYSYILQIQDGRVIFLVPWQQAFTLIGTTDFTVDEPSQTVSNECEITYLLDCVNSWFRTSLKQRDIIRSYAGIRCLQHETTQAHPSAITRDYKILVEDNNKCAPLLTIIGGKLTTFRALSENAVEKLRHYFPNMGPAWTASTPLPGGNTGCDFRDFVGRLIAHYHFLPTDLVQRYARTYGARTGLMLQDIRSYKDLGAHYGAGLYQREVDYLLQHEWARSACDILWRRTKLGLFMTRAEQEKLQNVLLSAQS